MATEPALSRRERQILDVVFARGKATVSQLMEDLPEEMSRSAVRTFLRILEDKGMSNTHQAHVPHISITISANMFRWWDVAVFLRERSGLWPTLTRIFFISRHVE